MDHQLITEASAAMVGCPSLAYTPSLVPPPDTEILAPPGPPSGDASTVVDLRRAHGTLHQTPFAPVDSSVPEKTDYDSSSGRYETRQLLGVGGMGEVRLCKDDLIGREVAVKAMRPDQALRTDLRSRFIREARVQGQLEHPAIVPVYDLSLARDPVFFTMKRVRGLTLEHVVAGLRDGDDHITTTFSRRKLLTAFTSVCLALDFAHLHGVIHRDLKPANVMLGAFGEVYVLDWGVAKVHDDLDVAPADPIDTAALQAKTEVGQVMGTPGYMSPEQMRGAPVDARADVYSLGATLFEILTLSPLHQGSTVSDVVMSTLVELDARVSARLADKDVAPELEAICVKATAFHAADRYASARELGDAIERYLDGDRDVALRRALAQGHAAAATEAKVRAMASEGAARDLAHRTALREVGRALALDPTNEEALRATLELRLLAPRELPEEARAELELARAQTFQASAKAGAIAIMSTFLYLPLLLWMGVRDPGPIVMLYGLIVVVAVIAYTSPSNRAMARFYTVYALTAVAFAQVSRMFGPFVLLPAILVATTARIAIDPSRTRRIFVVTLSCLAVIVPWALERLGVLSPSYVFALGGITIVPHAVSLPEWPSTLVMLAASLGTILACAITLGRVRRALASAEHRAHLQTWQLRQLVPDAAHRAASLGRTDPPPALPPVP
jgi:eukaryotic-like serine/threonine-protein kinase